MQLVVMIKKSDILLLQNIWADVSAGFYEERYVK
jgi:hypothetical protein